MTITVEQLFEKAFVISVDDFRYRTFCERFRKYGLDKPLPRLFRGFEIPNGIHNRAGLIKTKNICNCWMSHVAIVKMAQSLDWEFVCIFEDDALPCKDITRKLGIILSKIPQHTGILKFGQLGRILNLSILNEFFSQGRTLGSHAYVIFQNYYDEFLKNANLDLRIDVRALNTDADFRIYSTSEALFVQDDRHCRETLNHNKQFFEYMKNQNMLSGFDV